MLKGLNKYNKDMHKEKNLKKALKEAKSKLISYYPDIT